AERSGRAKRTDRAVQASLGKRTDPGFAARGSSSPEQQLPETVTAAAGQVESVGHSKSTQTAEEDVSRSAGGTEDASEGAAVTENASDISGKTEEVGETQRLGSHVEDVATLCEDEFRSTVLLETCAGVVYPKKPKRYVYGSRKYKKGPVNNFKKSTKAQRKKSIAEKAKAFGGGDEMTLSALERDGDCEGGLEGANGEGPSGVKRAHLEEEQLVVCDCDIVATVNKVIGGSELERAWKDEMDKFSRRLGVLQDLE
ncbi:unnamed protein product, partial [Ixodes persulcatus]